mmetsp:Transcript_3944/g.9478  ORF Transcript_3944/g.9478 Transcript_3944/m.9478 type:complete len:227 (-) Transcript_3944:1031-1711(-)
MAVVDTCTGSAVAETAAAAVAVVSAPVVVADMVVSCVVEPWVVERSVVTEVVVAISLPPAAGVVAKAEVVGAIEAGVEGVDTVEVVEDVEVVTGRTLICTATGMPLSARSWATSTATACRLVSESRNSARPLVACRTSTRNCNICEAASLRPPFTNSTDTSSGATFSDSDTASCKDAATASASVPSPTSSVASKLAGSAKVSEQTSRSQVATLAGCRSEQSSSSPL